MTPAQRWMGKVAALGCAVCRHMGLGETPAQVHHIKEGTGAAGAGRSDFLVIPLCPEHHAGASGIHTLKASGFYTRYGVTEYDLLADTIRRLA